MSMTPGFAEAFARICEELKARITQKVRAAGVTVAAGDIAQLQNVIVWMTIDPELQERLLMTALEPADWGRLEPDLPQISRVFHEELAFARAALTQLKEETVRHALADKGAVPERERADLDHPSGPGEGV
jgi:hypothetical protein